MAFAYTNHDPLPSPAAYRLLRLFIPTAGVHSKARVQPVESAASPTTVERPFDRSYASLGVPPRLPRSFIPPAAVHRNARYEFAASVDRPTTTEPSADTP